MTEQLGINGSLRNSSAIHGYKWPMFSWAARMDNFREGFFTYSTLSIYKHCYICWRYFQGSFKSQIKLYRIPYNLKALFYRLQIHIKHKNTLQYKDKKEKTDRVS